MSVLDAALQYIGIGFSVIPLATRSKAPDFAILPRNGEGKATWKPFSQQPPDVDHLNRWFNDGKNNIGLIMGRVSASAAHLYLAAIDFDQMDAYDKWSALYPQIANHTPTALTPNGAHVLIETRQAVHNWKISFQGQHVGEMRGEGGYIAVWPSIHPSGKQYEWVIAPWETAPLEVLNIETIGLTRITHKAAEPVGAAPAAATPAPPPQNGKYPLPPRTIRFMEVGAPKDVNNELYHAAIQHAAAGYSEQKTIDALLPVAERFYIGTGPGNTADQALRTIKSGWQGGQGKEPLTWGLGQESFRSKLGSKNGPNGNTPTNGKIEPTAAAEAASSSPNSDELKPRYTLEGCQMVYTTYKKVDDKVMAVKNRIPFTGQVTRKLILFEEDGTQQVTYTINGKKDGKPYSLDVEAEDFADGKKLFTRLLNYLPGGPPPIANTMIKHVHTAISTVTNQDQIEQIKATPYLGWTPDGKAFVTPNGSVGDLSYTCKLDGELAKEFKKFGFRQNTPDENRQAVDALLSLQQVYRPDAIHVLIGHIFLPPLLRWLGTQARYLLHIHAGSGSLKTELAKLAMAFYLVLDDDHSGKDQGNSAITYKWSSTPIGAESRAYGLKDCLMLIDDLKPNTLTPDVLPRWVAFIQAYVDAAPRKRGGIYGQAGAALPPRAVLLSTGEAIPEAGEASYTARMLLVELDSRPADAPRDTALDNVRDNKSHLFSGLMRAYIEWLQQTNGANAIEVLKHYQAKQVQTAHTRLSANYAANSTGAWLFAQFCAKTGLMSDDEKLTFEKMHQQAVLRVVAATSQKVQDERYSQKFISSLRDAISTGYARLSNTTMDTRNRVGWQDDDFVYLLNGSMAVVNAYLRQSGDVPLIIPMREVSKQLFEDGYSYSTQGRVDRGYFDVQRTDPADDSRPMVTAVYRAKFYGLDISDGGNPA